MRDTSIFCRPSLLGSLALCLLACVPAAADAGTGPLCVAHRGLLRHSPENTLGNFRACLELRHGFELDVRRTKDGHLVCLHDETVDRTTDGKGRVNDMTLRELKQLDAGAWFGPSFRGQRIPTLDEVFALVAKAKVPTALIAIDLKGDDAKIESDVVRLAKTRGVLEGLLFIGRAIRHDDVRRRLREADKKAQVAHLANTPQEFPAALEDRQSSWVYLRYVPSNSEVGKAHRAGKRVFLAGPTVAGLKRGNWSKAVRNGVDAILTDHPLELARQRRTGRRRAAEIRSKLQSHFAPPPTYRGDFGKYRSPLVFSDGRKVSTPAAWRKRREEVLKGWHTLLGHWPDLLKKPRIKYLARERREGVTQHKVQVEIYPGEKYTEGHLLVPDGQGPFPAVLVTFYDSATSVGLGKRGRGTHDYGLQLARRGFVTLSIGTPGSIESPEKRTSDLLTEAGERQGRQPLSFLAYVAANAHTALARLPNVDAERIGIVGLSYGGKWAMFASCLYDKFACAVWSDPGIVFNEENSNVNYWEPWYLGYEKGARRKPGVPSADRPRTGLYRRLVEAGRDLNELHALMCPRPVLVAGGTEDPPRNWQALNHLVSVNRLLGREDRVALTSRKTHVPTPEALEKTLLFLEYHLKHRE